MKVKHKKPVVDPAEEAKQLYESLIKQGFNSEQAFQLTLLILKKKHT